MNNKNKKTLELIFKQPVVANISWQDIETLFKALGADLSEGHGSRMRVILKGRKAIFHSPHLHKGTDKDALKSVRRFLENAGVKP